MQVTQEMFQATLMERAREAQQAQLVQQALQAQEEDAGRDRRPVNRRSLLPDRLGALSRRVQAIVHA